MPTANIPEVGQPMTTPVKAWYMSTTVWLAIVQALIGLLGSIALMLQNGVTTDSMAAFAIGLKGLVDLRQRFNTITAIK